MGLDIRYLISNHPNETISSWKEVSRILSVSNLEVTYNDVVLVLKGVSLEVPEGSLVALLGANGAGKTTLLRAINGLLDLHDGDVVAGMITLNGDPIHALKPHQVIARGIGHVMEGRRILKELTVEENLRVGGHRSFRSIGDNMQRAFDLFGVLAERRNQTAGYLSGGEQQMLAIGRALMADPKLLLLDEPSLGLAPRIVEQIRDIVVEINAQGTTVVLVEQNANMALSIADHGYVLETGRVVMDKAAKELLRDEDIRDFYLGGGDAGVVYADVKHYRRRKRWLS